MSDYEQDPSMRWANDLHRPETVASNTAERNIDTSTAEGHEEEPRAGPRIYVASLSDYNAGILHGVWIDAVEDVEEMQVPIDRMLQASPTTKRYGDLAEEWAIHDFDGFGELWIDENENLSTIARLADGIRQHGPAFSAWPAHVGIDTADVIQVFEDHYRGEWNSLEAYAEDLLDELGAERHLDELPEWLQGYVEIDVAGFARDLELGGDIFTVETPGGGVWVFCP